MSDQHTWGRYLRYHRDIYWPSNIEEAAAEFLPYPNTPLPTSLHYRELGRHLPADEESSIKELLMPLEYDIIEATVVRDTLAIFRVMIRFRWNPEEKRKGRQTDLIVVLDGDFELVTGFWRHPGRDIPEDTSMYEQVEPKRY